MVDQLLFPSLTTEVVSQTAGAIALGFSAARRIIEDSHDINRPGILQGEGAEEYADCWAELILSEQIAQKSGAEAVELLRSVSRDSRPAHDAAVTCVSRARKAFEAGCEVAGVSVDTTGTVWGEKIAWNSIIDLSTLRAAFPQVRRELRKADVPDFDDIELRMLKERSDAIEAARPNDFIFLEMKRSSAIESRLAADRDDSSETPDGPVEPRAFRWKGVVHDGLTGKAFSLVSTLWTSADRAASFETLRDTVWGDHALTAVEIEETRFGTHQRKANSFFAERSIPLRVCRRAAGSTWIASLTDRE